MMRRKFISPMGSTASLPLAAWAQQSRPRGSLRQRGKGCEELINQLRGFVVEKHYDLVDALVWLILGFAEEKHRAAARYLRLRARVVLATLGLLFNYLRL